MKRLVALLISMAALAAPTLASAHHLAAGKTKVAVVRGLHSSYHNLRQWHVIISGNNGASSRHVGDGDPGEWRFISHLQHGRWKYEGGSGYGQRFSCRGKGMPKAIARDLKVPCG
jgi:hypothetical protein